VTGTFSSTAIVPLGSKIVRQVVNVTTAFVDTLAAPAPGEWSA
jgi:hypothetical protein